MKRVVVALLLVGLVPIMAGGCGTGSPWVKQLRVAVVGLTTDGSGEVPLAGAQVTVTAASTTAGSRAASSQTLSTGPDGTATFRVEPGYTYTVAATATGYSAGQITVDVGFFAGTMTRTITLAVSAT
jgi:hypothetical protein